MDMFAKLLLSLSVLASLNLVAGESFVDRSDLLQGVKLTSGKKDSVREFSASANKKLPYSIEHVSRAIKNFSEKCNNYLRSKRVLLSKDVDCKFHNKETVETVVLKDLKKPLPTSHEAFLLERQMYNRGQYGYYEMVEVKEEKAADKKQIVISQRMLNDEEAATYTDIKFNENSTFKKGLVNYTLTEVSPNETTLEYSMHTETEHWLLNKELSIPQVFATISKSVNDLVNNIESDSRHQTRDIASK
jgi:hypothetical protein